MASKFTLYTPAHVVPPCGSFFRHAAVRLQKVCLWSPSRCRLYKSSWPTPGFAIVAVSPARSPSVSRQYRGAGRTSPKRECTCLRCPISEHSSEYSLLAGPRRSERLTVAFHRNASGDRQAGKLAHACLCNCGCISCKVAALCTTISRRHPNGRKYRMAAYLRIRLLVFRFRTALRRSWIQQLSSLRTGLPRAPWQSTKMLPFLRAIVIRRQNRWQHMSILIYEDISLKEAVSIP